MNFQAPLGVPVRFYEMTANAYGLVAATATAVSVISAAEAAKKQDPNEPITGCIVTAIAATASTGAEQSIPVSATAGEQ